MATELTWLGHAAFRIDSPGGKRIYVDPFLTGNPKCPDDEAEPERCDLIALTHGHDDHRGDTVAIAQRFDCPVIAQVELRGWLSLNGLSQDPAQAINKGGTVEVAGIKLTLTHANHSSSTFADGQFLYTGESCGFVIELEDGFTHLLRRGHERLRRHDADRPDLLAGRRRAADRRPLHDGPARGRGRARAARVPRCVPCHYGTFPLLTGTPDALRALAPEGVEILAPEPGETLVL